MTVEEISWGQVSHDLDADGNAVVKGVLSTDECDEVRELYQERKLFRSEVIMERHGFGVESIDISNTRCPR